MFNENDLESVYVVGQEITDRNLGETEKSDTEHDPRRLGLAYYDAVCDEVDIRQVMDPISTQSSSTSQENVILTPEPVNAPRTAEISTVGTVPYNNPNPRQQQQLGSLGAAPKQPRVLKPFDVFLTISTAFLNTLPAISL